MIENQYLIYTYYGVTQGEERIWIFAEGYLSRGKMFSKSMIEFAVRQMESHKDG